MSKEYALTVEQVSKKFCKSFKRSMWYGLTDVCAAAIGLSTGPALRPDEFWACDDISFSLEKGEALGVIGPNGAGKTTLLKLLNGILAPDKGAIEVSGRVGALIAVGAGFHPMLTGRENVYLNGAILGMSRREVRSKFDSIVDFADVGDFLDTPVRFYSSGMFVKLGFAVAAHASADILLIDEVLAVGDQKFQAKCFKFLTDTVLKNGASIVFVSHNRYYIQDLCANSVYLHAGRVRKYGPTAGVITAYLDDIDVASVRSAPQVASSGIVRIEFLNAQRMPVTSFVSGDNVMVRFHYSCPEPVVRPSIGFSLFHADKRYSLISSTDYIYNVHSGYDRVVLPELRGTGYVELSIEKGYLPIGRYTAAAYLYAGDVINLVQKFESPSCVEVLWDASSARRSLIELPHRWSVAPGEV